MGSVTAVSYTHLDVYKRQLEALEDLVEAANGKPVLIAYWYKHDLARIRERIGAVELDSAEDFKKWNADVYKRQMFHGPIEEVTKGSPLRQKGKISELALGYGGSIGALTSMGALDMGLAEEELAPLVSAWRSANPHIMQFWWDVDVAAVKAVSYTHLDVYKRQDLVSPQSSQQPFEKRVSSSLDCFLLAWFVMIGCFLKP